MRVPPPALYVGAFLMGLLVERFVPLSLGGSWSLPRLVVGYLFIALGAILGPVNAVRFLIRGTTLNPNQAPTLFLSGGFYRFSRNPMYLGLFLIYVGVALVNSKLWPLATMILPFLLLQRVVIPLEEQQMTKRFGQAYLDYCARVPRWF